MARLKSIIDSKLGGYIKPNTVSNLIANRIKAAVEEPEIVSQLDALVKAFVKTEVDQLPTTVKKVVADITRKILHRAFSDTRFDVNRAVEEALTIKDNT
jgi:hypothetical protein